MSDTSGSSEDSTATSFRKGFDYSGSNDTLKSISDILRIVDNRVSKLKKERAKTRTQNFQCMSSEYSLENPDCPICQENMGSYFTRFTQETCKSCEWEDQGVRLAHHAVRTRCGHVFGHECLSTWLMEPGNNSCPLCRSTLVDPPDSGRLTGLENFEDIAFHMWAKEDQDDWKPEVITIRVWGPSFDDIRSALSSLVRIHQVLGDPAYAGQDFLKGIMREWAYAYIFTMKEELSWNAASPSVGHRINARLQDREPNLDFSSVQRLISPYNELEPGGDFAVLECLRSTIEEYQNKLKDVLSREPKSRRKAHRSAREIDLAQQAIANLRMSD